MSYYEYEFYEKTQVLKYVLLLEQTREPVTQIYTQKTYNNLYHFSYVTIRSRVSASLEGQYIHAINCQELEGHLGINYHGDQNKGRDGWAVADRENVTDDLDDYFDAKVVDHSTR